jgi:hypothetical protein
MKSIQEKEQLIISTIINCNSEIKNFLNLNKKIPNYSNLMERNNIYFYNMTQLLSEINPLFESYDFNNLNNFQKESSPIINKRNNYYSYLNKVNDFLDGYERPMQVSLNESLTINANLIKTENPINLNIFTFKDDLKNIIQELSKMDDIQTLSPEILKIKLWAKKPLFIYGFDIVNNLALHKELVSTFNIEKIFSICFDKSNKQLIFLCKHKLNNSLIICYDIIKDELDLYTKINTDFNNISINFDKNYLNNLKSILDNNSIIELYIDITTLNLKFEDNLYFDKLRGKFYQENNQTKIVK